MRFVGGNNKKKNKSRDPATKLKKESSAAAADKQTATAPVTEDDNDKTPIYYFGYGAMVNPIARRRRGVNTDEAHAALLRNYRLTFSYGGAANIVEARGYEVYGIVMKCSTQEDWNLLRDFDAGYDCLEVDVFPLKQTDNTTDTQGRDCNFGQEDGDNNSLASEEEGFAQVYETPIKARVFVLPKDQLTASSSTSSEDTPPKIPQERYLKVIASGMRAYGVDPDYINDEILGVEFIPSRKPQEYLTFPPAADDIPTLSSLEAWNKEYQKLIHKDARQIQAKHNKKNHNTKTSSSPPPLIVFRLGQHIMRVTNPDMNNPFVVWVKDRMNGPQDSTWVIVQTLFDPDLPLIATPEEVTTAHQLWAENQMMEKFQQAGVQATTIYNVCLDSSNETSSTTPIQEQPQHQKGSSFQAFLRNSVRSLKSTKATSTTASQRTASNSITGGSNHQHHQQPNAPTSPAPSITSSTTSSKRRNRLFLRRLPKSKLTMSLRTKLLPTLRSNNSSSNHSATNASGGGGGSHSSHPSSRRSNKKDKKNGNSTTNNDENSATESIEHCCEEEGSDTDDDDLASPSVLAIHDGGGCCIHGVGSSGEFHQCHLVHDHEEELDDIEDNDLNVVDGATKDDDRQPVMILNPINNNNNDSISASSNVNDEDQEYDGTDGESPPPISCLAFATSTATTTTATITEEAKTRTTIKATLA